MIELEAENNLGCIEMRWGLNLDSSMAVSTSVASIDPEAGSTRITLDTVDSAINEH
jgi:hypothetical protein